MPTAEDFQQIADFEEDQDDIRYFPLELSAGGKRAHQRVKAASADRLVEWLTSAKYSGKPFLFLCSVFSK